MKLRGYILVVKIAETLQAQEQKKQEEKDVQEKVMEPPAKIQRIETPVRPPGMPQWMPGMPSGGTGIASSSATVSVADW